MASMASGNYFEPFANISECHILDLPNEMIYTILAQTTLEDVLSVRSTSTRFRAVTNLLNVVRVILRVYKCDIVCKFKNITTSDKLGITTSDTGKVLLCQSKSVLAIDMKTGKIDTIASTFWNPKGIAYDRDGSVVIADAGHDIIVRIGVSGKKRTIAGIRKTSGYVNGKKCLLDEPRGMAFDKKGNLIFCDAYNNRIRQLSRDGFVSKVAGSGNSNNVNETVCTRKAGFSYPEFICIDHRNGDIYIVDFSCDHSASTIRLIKNGKVYPILIAGKNNVPRIINGLAISSRGHLYFMANGVFKVFKECGIQHVIRLKITREVKQNITNYSGLCYCNNALYFIGNHGDAAAPAKLYRINL
mmetsp:Transcript_9550/g.10561  ORF Transcript_9550/g.10561 Transcript_9550/m.10561 type:complete len:358 (+) Transcript_9550:95-1168(+)